MSMWRERWEESGERKNRLERTELEKEGKKEEGMSSPFYSESGTSGCCQVTVGWRLDNVLTDSKTL